jgi:hypothetical protein
MQNAGCGGAATLQHQNDASCAVIADLVSLVERVQSRLRLVEKMIARSFRGNIVEISPETATASRSSSTSIILLNDIFPR